MKLVIALILSVLSFSVVAEGTVREALPEAREFKKWKFNSYYKYSFEMGVRASHDAWTHTSIDTLVISCIVEPKGGKTLRFFVATYTPIHNLGEKVKAYFKVGDTSYEMDAQVSNIYVGNVHIVIPNELSELLDKMKSSRRVNVYIPSIGGIGFDRDFSLMGFSQASLNPITTCIYGE